MQTVSWINSAGGDWTTGSDWSTGVVPGPGDDVAIDASGIYTVTINSDQTVLSLGVAASATVAITSGSSLTVSGGAGASVSAGATLSVGTGSSLDLSSPLSVAGTLVNAGAVSGGGATAVTFASSTDRLILDPRAAFTGALVGGGANTTLELANGSGAGTLDALGTSFTDFGAVTVDPGATWTVDALASALAGMTITGNRGSNLLEMISAGAFSLGEISQFPTVSLAAGNNTVTVTDTTLSGGLVTIEAGASGNETIGAAGDTAASEGKILAYYAATGTDSFTGGFENDSVHVSATAVGGDTLTGGSGANTLALSSAGSVNLGGVSRFATIYLAAGSNTVTVTDTTLSGGPVALHDGPSGNNRVNIADTAASKGAMLYYVAGETETDRFIGGFENDTIYIAGGAALGRDMLTGGSGTNALVMTSASTVNLARVSEFPNIYLAAGNNEVLVTDTTLSGGSVAVHDGTSGSNNVSAAGDTAASKGKTLYYVTATGAHSFLTGGFENDTVRVSATAVGGDKLTGGSGANALVMTSAGTVILSRVSKFANIYLAAGNNTVTVTDATLSGGSVALRDGASGNNTISAAGDTAASRGKTLTYLAGTGTDSFTGGFENDIVYGGSGNDTMHAGSGNDTILPAPG